MTKANLYPVVVPQKGFKILGTDPTNTIVDANGATVNFSTDEISLVRVVENIQTGTAYQLVLVDVDAIVTMNNAASNTVTIPSNSTTAIPVGATVMIHQEGAGITTIRAASGVTLRGLSAGACQLSARYGAATLYKRSANAWIVMGAIGAVA